MSRIHTNGVKKATVQYFSIGKKDMELRGENFLSLLEATGALLI